MLRRGDFNEKSSETQMLECLADYFLTHNNYVTRHELIGKKRLLG